MKIQMEKVNKEASATVVQKAVRRRYPMAPSDSKAEELSVTVSYGVQS